MIKILLLMLLSCAACAQQGLVGYWPMDEGAGSTFDDLSGCGKPGILISGCKWEKSDREICVAFSPESRSSAVIPSLPAWDYAPGQVGDLTIALWVRADKSGFVASHYYSGTPGAWGLIIEGGNLMFNTYLDRKEWTEDRKHVSVLFKGFQMKQWQFVTLVWKRGKDGWLKAYLDGKEVDSVLNVPATTSLQSVTYIGSRNGSEDRIMTGMLRGLCIFNRVLSAEEVQVLFAQGPQLTSPVLVSELTTDKILYFSRENISCRYRVRNSSVEDRTLKIIAESLTNLDDRKLRKENAAELKAGGMKEYSLEIPAREFRMGNAVAVSVIEGEKVLAAKHVFFQVGDDLGEVAIGAASPAWSQTGLESKKAEILRIPEEARERGINMIEIFFWSPDDWSLHVPRTDRWWSGQTSYPEDREILKEFIGRAHAHGIRTLMYASCNPAGPFGWEAAYRHPEWFLDGNGLLPSMPPEHVEALDNWNNPVWRKAHPGNPGWLRVKVDLRNLDAVDYGIKAILDGAKFFGWDGVRFDGHYTIHAHDEISTRNMRRLKELVGKEHPGFVLGYNYGRAPEWRNGWTHEMREAMAGGGIYLQEGIRAWWKDSTKYSRWNEYAVNELRIAKRLQSLGGFYHCMWECKCLPPDQAFYKFAYGLIAGGHPMTFDESIPYCRDWGAFMTRWSRFLWDRGLRYTDTKDTITVEPDKKLFWRPLVQELIDSAERKFLVVHLVNPPVDDAIDKTAMPPPAGDVVVSYKPGEGESLEKAMLVSPQADPFGIALPAERAGESLLLKIKDAPLWSMLILELKGKYTMPWASPAFTETPDAGEVEKAMQGALKSRIADPNKDAETDEVAGDVRIWETDAGMSGLGAKPGSDPDAVNGSCQVNDCANVKLGHSKKFMGYTSLGPLRPGKYRLSYRMKWTEDENGSGWKVLFYVTDQTLNKDVVKAEFVSPPRPGDPGNTLKKLEPPGKYHDYSFEFVKIDPGYVNACAIVDTAADGEQKIFMDHIRTEMLEPMPDRELVKLLTKMKKNNPAPSGMDTAETLIDKVNEDIKKETVTSRRPAGGHPAKFLLIKGLMADLYSISASVSFDTVYSPPSDAVKLFAYDCVIMANTDLTFSSLVQRKNLKDFVEAGGRLVVLGGIATLGNGGMTKTFIDDMLPVQITGIKEVRKFDKPELLGREKGIPFADSPAVFWRHCVNPKPDACLLAYAGTEPIAFSGKYGDGRVFIFLGTTLGPGGCKDTPFWQTDSWRELLKKMVE